MPNTANGIPYPDPTAPAKGAYADMRALAAAVAARAIVISGGAFTITAAEQDSGQGHTCILPGLSSPLGGMSIGNMPAGGNPRRRFSYMTRPAGGNALQVEAFNITEPFIGNYPPSPDNVPNIPVCVIGWAPPVPFYSPPADGLYRDVPAHLEQQARGMDNLGMAAVAGATFITPNNDGVFSLAVPGFQVEALVATYNRGDWAGHYNITSGLGTSNLAMDAFIHNIVDVPDGYPQPLRTPGQMSWLAVGYHLDANGQRVRPRRRA